MRPLFFLLALFGIASALPAAEPIFSFDFTTQPAGRALPWLLSRGFEDKLQFADLNPKFQEGALWFSSARPVSGLGAYNFPPGRALKGVKRVRLTWGAGSFPEGADWERGRNRTPLAIMISLGNDRLPSGLPFGINPAPYFIAPFLAAREPEGKVYTGRYWKAGGRYVAVRCKPGATIITEVDLDRTFRTQFGTSPTPPVTAIAIQMNTKDTKGPASAFMKKIEFLAE